MIPWQLILDLKTLLVNHGLLKEIFHQKHFSDVVGAGIDGSCSCANCMEASYITQLMRFGSICYSVDSMPPTSDALRFHLMRAFYQFIVWRSAAITEPDMIYHLLQTLEQGGS